MSNWLSGPWWGKLVGALLGFAVKGPVGAVVGALLGHQFDRGLRDFERKDSESDRIELAQKHQQLFFFTTFSVMGHLAKSDGRVSQEEISAASDVMKSWELSPQQVELAIKYFSEGKAESFNLTGVLNEFKQAVGGNQPTLTAFVRAQIQVMLADHQIHPASRQRAWEICQHLGISRVDMAALEEQIRKPRQVGSISSLSMAYNQLEITQDVADDDVKTAYRRMMSRYHPDKLIDSDMSEQDHDKAKQTLERCRQAYQLIKTNRGMR